jgi:hypothetical protein
MVHSRENRVRGVFQQTANEDLVLIDSIQLGTALVTNIPAWRRTPARYAGPKVGEAVLGRDFLLRTHAVVDCLDAQLYVRSSPPSMVEVGALEASFRKSNYRLAALKKSEALVPHCFSRVNDHEVKLLVDTGAVWSVVDDSVTSPARLRADWTGVLIAGVLGAPPTPLRVAEVGAWEVGE